MYRTSFKLTIVEVTLSFVTSLECDISPSKFYPGLLSGLPESYLLPVYTCKWRDTKLVKRLAQEKNT